MGDLAKRSDLGAHGQIAFGYTIAPYDKLGTEIYSYAALDGFMAFSDNKTSTPIFKFGTGLKLNLRHSARKQSYLLLSAGMANTKTTYFVTDGVYTEKRKESKSTMYLMPGFGQEYTLRSKRIFFFDVSVSYIPKANIYDMDYSYIRLLLGIKGVM